MGILSKLLPSFPSFKSAGGLRYADEWNRRHAGVLYEFVREADRGVQIRESNADVYENMESGEVRIVRRTDSRKEWHSRDDRREWPEQVERAQREGYVWHADLRDPEFPIPPFRGHIIGGGNWTHADDDIEPPREEWSP